MHSSELFFFWSTHYSYIVHCTYVCTRGPRPYFSFFLSPPPPLPPFPPPEHGYCTHPNDCTCEQDYEGTLCNIDLDPCGHQTPCANGECNNDGPNLYSCTCDAGYTGTNCDVDIDECFLNPCQNEGSCEVRECEVWWSDSRAERERSKVYLPSVTTAICCSYQQSTAECIVRDMIYYS